MRHTGIFLVTGLLLLVSACATTPDPAACPCDPPSGLAYNDFSSNTGGNTDGTTSSLLGVGVSSLRSGGADSSSLLTSSGTLTHSNKAISFSVSDGYVFANTTGPSTRNSDVYNGAGTDRYSVTDTYDYVRAYTMEYSYDGAGYEFLGVHGIATQDTDVQDAASRNVMADYTGVAIIDIDLSDITVANIRGVSTVSADFAGNTVDVNMGSFADNSIITAIDISGMAIVGNSFSGGTMTVEGIASGLANRETHTGTGYFYGWDDSDGSPAEVGGTVFLVEDDDNYLYATFLGRKTN